MNSHFLRAAVLLLVVVGTVSGQPADDRYVQVYSMIEEADKLNDGGQARQAVTKYLEAQVALKELQQSFPDWNKKIIAYRLSYISSRLEPLAKKLRRPQRAAQAPRPVRSHAPHRSRTRCR